MSAKRKALRYDWKKVLVALPQAIEKFHRDYGTYVLPNIRLLFYVLISMELLPNVKKAYKSLDHVLVEERLAGRIPWGSFRLDKEREPVGWDWTDIEPLDYARFELGHLKDAVHSYSLSFWQRQGWKVIIACEKVGQKELIASVVADYHVRVIPGRGYAAWETWANEAQDLKRRGLRLIILYVGDFDPSGEDMPKFLARVVAHFGLELEEPIKKIAVAKPQIERFKLPHEPENAEEIEKMRRDPRFRKWPWGLYRVETEALIALQADFFKELLRGSVERYIDREKVKEWEAEVEEKRAKLAPILDKVVEEGEAVLDELEKSEGKGEP